jgi:penicillin-binding protein 2
MAGRAVWEKQSEGIDMKRPVVSARIVFLAVVVMLGLGGLSAKLWYVQVARGGEYTARIRAGSQVTVRIPAVRGEILDRNGLPLVQNRASFDVDFYLPDMVRAFREENGVLPLTKYRGTVHNMPKDLKEADVVEIVKESILPRMEELGVAENYNARRMQIHYRNNREVPFNYMQDLDFETMAILSERNLELPGVTVTKKPVRQYVYGSLAAHLLGYVGKPRRLDEQPDIAKFNFYDPDMEGKAQVEQFMDDYLRGTPGARILQRNARGVIEGEAEIIEPRQGDNVYLTLDARIQYIAENALRVVGRGAAVVVDPNNGDILAMASVPSFDPNTFIPAIQSADWSALTSDDTDPLVNRAISSYAPGSTYKVLISLAGLHAHKASSYPCGGGISIGNTFMKCHSSNHGTLSLENALKVSCNGYFYRMGIAAGIDHIVAMGNMLGFGQRSGIPLSGESPGILPGPEYLAQVRPRERWSSGYTANTSIGQGEVLASPLQMAMLTATVANGGTAYVPRLVDKVVAQDGQVVLQEPAKVRANLIQDAGLTPEDVERVREGMRRVVMEGGGTGRRAGIEGISMGGKTGTAQNWAMRDGKRMKDNHVWFVAFAPIENPRFAIAVLVQGAHAGGAVAAPIAGKILEEAFALPSAEAPAVEPPSPDEEEEGVPRAEPVLVAALEPAVGNFQFVRSIDFGREIPAAFGSPEDPEVASDTEAGSSQQAERPENPDIREDADERGRVQNRERKPSGLQKFFNFLTGKDRKERERQRPQQPPQRR